MIVTTAEIKSGYVAKDDLVPFRCSPVSLRARYRFKRRRRWLGVKGSTHNGRKDPKCPSTRRLRMVREETSALVKVLPVPGWRPIKQLAVRVNILQWGGLFDD
ncbi:hypothetical protein TNCV_21731 [Trichonephila clavipes]|nr:hypothetical protein TNCV_21731 [Trichonephila clavipes]